MNRYSNTASPATTAVAMAIFLARHLGAKRATLFFLTLATLALARLVAALLFLAPAPLVLMVDIKSISQGRYLWVRSACSGISTYARATEETTTAPHLVSNFISVPREAASGNLR